MSAFLLPADSNLLTEITSNAETCFTQNLNFWDTPKDFLFWARWVMLIIQFSCQTQAAQSVLILICLSENFVSPATVNDTLNETDGFLVSLGLFYKFYAFLSGKCFLIKARSSVKRASKEIIRNWFRDSPKTLHRAAAINKVSSFVNILKLFFAAGANLE